MSKCYLCGNRTHHDPCPGCGEMFCTLCDNLPDKERRQMHFPEAHEKSAEDEARTLEGAA